MASPKTKGFEKKEVEKKMKFSSMFHCDAVCCSSTRVLGVKWPQINKKIVSSVLQCVAVCISVLQRVAACCSAL